MLERKRVWQQCNVFEHIIKMLNNLVQNSINKVTLKIVAQ